MARPDLRARVASQRAQRIAQDRLRIRRSISARDGVRLQLDGRWLISFCSNDYLGLASDPRLQAALCGASSEGSGATASHLVCGHHRLHQQLEQELAEWLGYPSALLFGSGFSANLAMQQALLERNDVCVQDKLNHASLLDATQLAGARLRRYPHLDIEAAERQLQADPQAAAMLVSDAVFSMDGDIAPLPALAQLAQRQQALLYVDDAHGIGVLGAHGRGSVAAAGLGPKQVPLQLATFGKALGSYGAAVVGETALVRHLAETARGYIYTTALPPAQAAATLMALRIARDEDWRRQRLGEAIGLLREQLLQHGFEPLPSTTPIQPLLAGDEAQTLALAAAVEQAGFMLGAIRPPTVPAGSSRLRITLSALHTDAQILALVEALARARDTLRPSA